MDRIQTFFEDFSFGFSVLAFAAIFIGLLGGLFEYLAKTGE